jgi:beta-phosphoglucomutase-like phosphatase (HAD superfamily)
LLVVLFDMDGLLVDSEPAWSRVRVALLAAHGKPWTDADQRACAGVHTDAWVGALFDRSDGQLGREAIFEGIVDRMAGYYERGEVPILEGASDALQACARRYRVGLASGERQAGSGRVPRADATHVPHRERRRSWRTVKQASGQARRRARS